MPPIWVRTVCALALLAAPIGAAPARAQASTPPAPASAAAADTLTLTLPEAQARALRSSPAFLADAQALGVARGRLRQARTYPFNPELELEAPGAATGEGLGVYQAALTREIEAPGRTRLRARAAGLGLDRAGAEVRDAARLALAATGVLAEEVVCLRVLLRRHVEAGYAVQARAASLTNVMRPSESVRITPSASWATAASMSGEDAFCPSPY